MNQSDIRGSEPHVHDSSLSKACLALRNSPASKPIVLKTVAGSSIEPDSGTPACVDEGVLQHA